MNISNIKIHKRTFEGETDSVKNDNPITSKYCKSKKYAVSYDIEGYCHNPTVKCVTSKKEAQDFIEKLKATHNVS